MKTVLSAEIFFVLFYASDMPLVLMALWQSTLKYFLGGLIIFTQQQLFFTTAI